MQNTDNPDEGATEWRRAIAARVGRAVAELRKAQGISVVELASRTKDLGFPIHRVAISKIENNQRAGKLDVAELVILASALNVWPAWLLFPELPDGSVEVVPGRHIRSVDAADWLAGLYWFPPTWMEGHPDDKTPEVPDTFDLLGASRMLRDLDRELKSIRVQAIRDSRRDPDNADEIDRRYQEKVDELTPRRDDLAAAIRQHGGVVGEFRTELPTVPHGRHSDA
ncbi:helix-turn-helix domain-containing protein [Nocardia brevicatena]|uniref:helix-turn-helix domain-containing protein n=1 Tax=Nocardia brevicatena TaxID=37327 RepID=UPI0006890BB9|nr:helix-turn-helix transcriptional regulator [Nocardia brevicatena]